MRWATLGDTRRQATSCEELDRIYKISRIDRISARTGLPGADPPHLHPVDPRHPRDPVKKQQPQTPKVLTTSVAKNALGDTIRHATEIMATLFEKIGQDHRMSRIDRIKER